MKNKQLPSAGPDKNLVTVTTSPPPGSALDRKSRLPPASLWGNLGPSAPLLLTHWTFLYHRQGHRHSVVSSQLVSQK